jgi:5'-deoxynucleotidase YfbR-like HD superfamily hydrolase
VDVWEALARDIHANGNSVRDAIAKHRPAIEAEARQGTLDAVTTVAQEWNAYKAHRERSEAASPGHLYNALDALSTALEAMKDG